MLPAPPASVVAVGTTIKRLKESSTNSFNLFVIVSLG